MVETVVVFVAVVTVIVIIVLNMVQLLIADGTC